MFWHLGQDDEEGSLLRSLYTGLYPEEGLKGGLHYEPK
jgi:hypothetical protein